MGLIYKDSMVKHILSNTKNITDYKLLLMMTTGMSLSEWKKLGQLDREISIYSKIIINITYIITIYINLTQIEYLTVNIGFWHILFLNVLINI